MEILYSILCGIDMGSMRLSKKSSLSWPVNHSTGKALSGIFPAIGPVEGSVHDAAGSLLSFLGRSSTSLRKR